MMPVLFLHGWAQSQQVWFQQHRLFADARFLNLPGHGGAPDLPAEAWLDHLAGLLPDRPCMLVGWSLGGMLAMQLAHRLPERVAKLVLIGTTPRFCAAEDWPQGCAQTLFDGFQAALASRSRRALNRFFRLMLQGDGLTQESYNRIAADAVDRAHPPTFEALQAGLDLLKRLDLRAIVPTLSMPALLLHGEADAIIDPACARWLADHLPNASCELIPACGHAPLLTQPASVNGRLKSWQEST